MGNKSKAKGTRAETAVVKFLQEHGWEAKRKALSGSKDCGDIEAINPTYVDSIAIEVKAGKQTANPNRAQLEEWLRQSRVEAKNSDKDLAVLCVVRYRRQIKDADVYLQYYDSDGYFTREHMFLDEFANYSEIRDDWKK